MKIGFIGLGKMGGALARNLIRTGHSTIVYDLSNAAVERTLAVGGERANTPGELAEQVDVLFTSLPLPQHLTDLLLNDAAIMGRMKPGSILVDVSTIGPDTAREVHDAAEKLGLHFLACPLGKGPAHAEQGTQPIYVGGKKEVFLQVEALLNQMSSSVTYLGDVEQSTAFKLISNLMLMMNMLVLAEGLRLGDRAGLEPVSFQKLLAETGADSYQLALRGPMILEQDYEAKFSINLASKDIRLGVEMAKQLAQLAPFSELAMEYYSKAQSAGLGEEDCAAVYKLF